MIPRAEHFLGNLEIHVAHACNLHCESCSHFSDQGHPGVVSVNEAVRWIAPWRDRLRPKMFSLVGGEPTLHPDLVGFLRASRRAWPSARIRVITNGFFLHRHPALPAALADDPDAWLYLSIHHEADDYMAAVLPHLRLVRDWAREYPLRLVVYRSYKDWTRRYRGRGAAMMPYSDGDPRRSWERCPAKTCRQLFDGKLWKCSPLAYLKLQQRRFQLDPVWAPYLAYEGMAPGCSDDELAAFLGAEEQPECGMCPAETERFDLPPPLSRRNLARPSPTSSAEPGALLREIESLARVDPRDHPTADRDVPWPTEETAGALR